MPSPRTCRACGCNTLVYAPKVMCDTHWGLIPMNMKLDMIDAFSKGFHVDNQPTADFNRAVLAAVKTLALMEAQQKQSARKRV